MAAAVQSSSTKLIDPTKPGKYPVSLSDRLSAKDGKSRSIYTSIKYNHKPSQSRNEQSIITHSSTTANNYDLSLNNDNGSYFYTGNHRPSSGSYILLFDPIKQAFTLEESDGQFSFNLITTPLETNSKVLAKKYPQLPLGGDPSGSGSDEELFDIGNEDGEPDPDNPFDYRHFLNKRRSSSPEPSHQQQLQQRILTPITTPLQRRGEPITKPKPKPKPRAAKPPQARPPKPKPKLKSPPREEQNVYGADDESSEVDADADVDADDDNDGVLTIQDPDTKTKQRTNPRIGRLTATAATAAAPFSLRSAATSVSPAGREVDESSESSDEDEVANERQQAADSDVEMLELPSPAGLGVTGISVAQTPGDDVDADGDDDELEKELAQALESQEDGDVGITGGAGAEIMDVTNSHIRPVESESESEEE
ncbi:MAG: hypothetical protein M1827_005261 [Pycnora praestabilis]|nr:MAG: hypothetical protein M1827_005261 [Pycnora praestabilis]